MARVRRLPAVITSLILVVAAFTVAMLCRKVGAPGAAVRAPYRACEVAYLSVLVGSLAYLAATAAAGQPPLLVGLFERLLLGSALAWCSLLAGANAPAG
jgi:hypothetical protein